VTNDAGRRIVVIDHPSGLTISPNLNENSAARIEGIVKKDMGTGYVWYYMPPADFSGAQVSFSLCFNSGSLESLSVCLIDSEQYGSGWDDWSEDKEQLRAKHTGEWLSSIGLSEGHHQWGDVWVGYDSKGGCGNGVIRFNP